MNRARLIQGSCCLLSGLAVVLGAFGAHALEERLIPDMLDVYHTASHYHFLHALALWFAGDAVRTGRRGEYPALFFLIGIFLFSGSLYAMSLTGATWLGKVTPIGGFCFIVGWALLARAVMHGKH